MHKIYLSAFIQRAREMNKYAEELENLGFVVVSRWHRLAADRNLDRPLYGAAKTSLMNSSGEIDLIDMDASDTLVLHPAPIDSPNTGGRFFENGYMFALKRDIYIIGERTNPFHYIKRPNLHIMDNWEDFILEAKQKAEEQWGK